MGSGALLDLLTVQRVMADLGSNCVLIGGWGSYIHSNDVDLSADVDAILNPYWDKQRVVELIGADETQLDKFKGRLHDSKVDLYIPRKSKIGGIPVEKLLPYSMEKDGVRVLIPEAHMLTKAACVLDDGRYRSRKRTKDVAEVRKMMQRIDDPRMPVSLWSSIVEDNSSLTERWNTLMGRVSDGVSQKDRRAWFDSKMLGFRGAITGVQSTLSDNYPLETSNGFAVVHLPVEQDPDTGMPALNVVKFSFKDGNPNTVERLNGTRWVDSRSVRAGAGRVLLTTATGMHPVSRSVPKDVAAQFGKDSGKCLMCGKPLKNPESLARGYGPECASKLR